MMMTRLSSLVAVGLLLLMTLCHSGTHANDCPSEFILIGGKCFDFQRLGKTWSDAEAYCEEKHADLAVVDDLILLWELTDYIYSNEELSTNYFNFWIGGYDLYTEGYWKWVTGENISMSRNYWGTSINGTEPNGNNVENCLNMDKNYGYNFADENCGNEYACICSVDVVAAPSA